MAGRDPSAEELAAANFVADALGGRWDSRDGGSDPSGMHDFDVRRRDDSVIALEVTSAIDGAVVALSVAAFGTPGREQRWPASNLTNDWIVTIPQKPIRVNETMRELPAILQTFEENGFTEVDSHLHYEFVNPRSALPESVRQAARKMVKLGVTRTRTLSPRQKQDAEMFITISGGMGGDPEAIDRLVVERAEPKRQKLGRAKEDGAAECHLFIWLDATQPAAELAMSKMSPPAAPELPPEIDVVWLATPPLAKPEKVWCARKYEGWTVLR